MTFNEIYSKFKKLEEAVLVLCSSLMFVMISNSNNLDKQLVSTMFRVLDDCVVLIDDSRAKKIKEDIIKLKKTLII